MLGSDKHWGWFNDETCFLEMNKGFIFSLLFNMGYTAFDFWLCVFRIKERTPLVKQTIGHHIVLIMGFSFTFLGGYFVPSLGVLSLYCEISSLFLSYRDLMKDFKDTACKQTLDQLNTIAFFISFTIFRTILFPYILITSVKFTWLMSPILPVHQLIGMILSSILFLLITCLNLFWYKIILKKVYRMVTGSKGSSK